MLDMFESKPLMTSHTTQWPLWGTDDEVDLEAFFANHSELSTGINGYTWESLLNASLFYDTNTHQNGGHFGATGSAPTAGSSASAPSMLLRFVCESLLPIPMCLLGMVGNILAVLVLCRQKQRQSTTLILQSLAITDTLILLATLFLRSIRYVSYYTEWSWLEPYMHAYKYIFYIVFPLVYFLRLIDTWLIVLLTIDRYIAVCHPLHAQRLCTYPRAVKNIIVLFLVAFFFSVPRFFEYKLTSDPRNHFGFEASIFGKNQNYTIAYKIVIFAMFMYFIPMALLVILNTILLRTLRTAEIFRSQIHTERGRSSGRSRSITAVVVTVVLVAIICNLTAMITHLLWSLHVAFPTMSHLETYRRYLALISNVFVTFNSAINFGIYCLCSRNFRTGLRRLMKCYADKAGLVRSQSSLRTTGTYISLTHSSTIRKKTPKGGDNTVNDPSKNTGIKSVGMEYLPNKLLYA